MRARVAAVLVAVVAGVITVVVTGAGSQVFRWIRGIGKTSTAEVRIVAANVKASFVLTTEYRTAMVSVQNDGTRTAENCAVHWRTGLEYLGSEDVQDSDKFAIPPGPPEPAPSLTSYGSLPPTRLFSGVGYSIRVVCGNAKSQTVSGPEPF